MSSKSRCLSTDNASRYSTNWFSFNENFLRTKWKFEQFFQRIIKWSLLEFGESFSCVGNWKNFLFEHSSLHHPRISLAQGYSSSSQLLMPITQILVLFFTHETIWIIWFERGEKLFQCWTFLHEKFETLGNFVDFCDLSEWILLTWLTRKWKRNLVEMFRYKVRKLKQCSWRVAKKQRQKNTRNL